jgi:hypothetical protein
MAKTSNFHFTGDINVHTMQKQSGIFIGERNIAIGWSTHGKENSVIGNISGQSNLLFHNISILNDPDFIDTPIDDRDINISIEQPADDTTNLTLESINVNAMAHSSTFFLGKGHINGLDSNDKANYTQGNLFGDNNKLFNNVNINCDQDVADGIMNDQDIKIANITKEA